MRNLLSRMTPWRTAALIAVAALAFCAYLAAVAQDNWERRDAWQRPAEVMDALGLVAGSRVADVGAGSGYFTFRLAERVGPEGRVYAVDISKVDVEKIRERAKRDALVQIEAIFSAKDDPQLPAESLDAILVVNAYHEMREFDAMMQGFYRALKPGGRLGIIDDTAEAGKPRSYYFDRHKISETLVREDAERNGFRFRSKEPGFRNADSEDWFFLLFEKP